jgi:GNAT superfamily N-acetyltransferase
LHGLPRPVRLGPGMAEETTHRLADGTKIRTRPLRPDDREKLRNGFARMSPESKYRRFFAAPATLSERTLDYLTHTDGWNHVAVGAELADEGADPSYGIGIARFVRLADHPGTAEAAVAVIDEMQRRGVGRLLLGELIKAAREREITTFVCYVLPSNEPVKSLLHTLDAEAKPRLENGVLTYELTLPEAAPHERDAAAMYRLFRLAAEGLRVIFRRVPGSEPDEPGE